MVQVINPVGWDNPLVPGAVRENTVPLTVTAEAGKETVQMAATSPVVPNQAINPRTGWYETVKPEVPFNANPFSPQDKAKAVTDLGYKLIPGKEGVGFEKIQNAFSRNPDGTIKVDEKTLSPYFTKTESKADGAIPGPSSQSDAIKTAEAAKTAEEANAAKLKAQLEESQKSLDDEAKRAREAQDALNANQKAIYDNQIAQNQALQSETETMMKDQLARYQSTTAPLLEAEKAANQANLAKAQVDQEAALYDAKLTNEQSQVDANISYAKLGLTLSGSAIQATQRIATQWAYNIAKLRVDGAAQIYGLKAKITQVEVDHSLRLNAAIDATNKEILDSKKSTLKEISSIQNNIILSDKEKEAKISEITDKFISNKTLVAEKLYQTARTSANEVERQADKIAELYKKAKEEKKSEISNLVKNWRWYSLTPAQRADYEKAAWVPSGSTDGEVTATISTGIDAVLTATLKDFKGSAATVEPRILAEAKVLASTLIKSGTDMKGAISYATSYILKNDPEIRRQSQLLTSGSEAAKRESEIEVNEVEKDLKSSNIRLNNAKTKEILTLLPAKQRKLLAEAAKKASSGNPTGYQNPLLPRGTQSYYDPNTNSIVNMTIDAKGNMKLEKGNLASATQFSPGVGATISAVDGSKWKIWDGGRAVMTSGPTSAEIITQRKEGDKVITEKTYTSGSKGWVSYSEDIPSTLSFNIMDAVKSAQSSSDTSDETDTVDETDIETSE